MYRYILMINVQCITSIIEQLRLNISIQNMITKNDSNVYF